jgi:hypothetical protein
MTLSRRARAWIVGGWFAFAGVLTTLMIWKGLPTVLIVAGAALYWCPIILALALRDEPGRKGGSGTLPVERPGTKDRPQGTPEA